MILMNENQEFSLWNKNLKLLLKYSVFKMYVLLHSFSLYTWKLDKVDANIDTSIRVWEEKDKNRGLLSCVPETRNFALFCALRHQRGLLVDACLLGILFYSRRYLRERKSDERDKGKEEREKRVASGYNRVIRKKKRRCKALSPRSLFLLAIFLQRFLYSSIATDEIAVTRFSRLVSFISETQTFVFCALSFV